MRPAAVVWVDEDPDSVSSRSILPHICNLFGRLASESNHHPSCPHTASQSISPSKARPIAGGFARPLVRSLCSFAHKCQHAMQPARAFSLQETEAVTRPLHPFKTKRPFCRNPGDSIALVLHSLACETSGSLAVVKHPATIYSSMYLYTGTCLVSLA